MQNLYIAFQTWLASMTMEEVFIFTYLSIFVVSFAIGIPLALCSDKINKKP